MAKVKVKIETTNIADIELATYDKEKWFIKNIEQRKNIGVFGAYTLDEWKSILSTLLKKEVKSV